MNASTSIGGDVSSPAGLSKADLQQMMRDPRYFDNARRDPTYVKQVDDGFARLYKK